MSDQADSARSKASATAPVPAVRSVGFIGSRSSLRNLAVVSPGSLKLWPINNQPALFELIGGVEARTGVTLAPSHLMTPLKSISGIFFVGRGGYAHNCTLCDRDVCEGRTHPYDPELANELEGSEMT